MKSKENKLRKAIQFVANPHLLLCFGIAWLITNGWSYIFFGLGTYYEIDWLLAISTAYITFLWLPISPEKIVTVAIAIFLLRRLFPKDEKTLGVLNNFQQKIKRKIGKHKDISSNGGLSMDMQKENQYEWVLCPVCGNKTRNRIREDTVLINYPLFCPKCKKETLISVRQRTISVIKEPDAQTQSR